MSSIQRYSTANAGSRAHIAYWNGVLHDLLVPLRVTASEAHDFEAELLLGQFGAMPMARIRCSPVTVDYDNNHIEQAGPHFFSLHIAVVGTFRFSTFGRVVTLGEGDLILSDSHATCQMECAEQSEVMSIQIEPAALASHLPAPEQFLGIPIRRSRATGGLLSSMMQSIWEQIGQGLPDEYAQPLAQSLLQVLAMYFALEHGPRIAEASSTDLRRTTIKRHIEANLNDPQLSAHTIAAAMGVSTRYVFRAFAGSEESLNEYIQRRRLEQVSFYLRNPLWSHWTITKIAMHWGFASVPHFSRVFKQHFGQRPGEFRRRCA